MFVLCKCKQEETTRSPGDSVQSALTLTLTQTEPSQLQRYHDHHYLHSTYSYMKRRQNATFSLRHLKIYFKPKLHKMTPTSGQIRRVTFLGAIILQMTPSNFTCVFGNIANYPLVL